MTWSSPVQGGGGMAGRELVAEVDVDVLLLDRTVQASRPSPGIAPLAELTFVSPEVFAGLQARRVGRVLRHDRVRDVRARRRARTGSDAAVAGAVVRAEVVRRRAVVGEGVAAVERAVLGLLTGDRRLEAVRPDLRVESGDGRAGVSRYRRSPAAGPGSAFGCCQWSVTYLLRMTSSAVFGCPSGPRPSRYTVTSGMAGS